MSYQCFLNQCRDCFRRLIGVYDPYPLRRCRRTIEVSQSYALVEFGTLQLEAVQLACLRGDPPAGDRRRQIEEQRQVRLQMTVYPPLKLGKLASVEAPPAALVGVGGVAEAVADHPVAAFQGRFDYPFKVFAAPPGRSARQRPSTFSSQRATSTAPPLSARC